MEILRVFNNNVVLARDDAAGDEAILTGRGRELGESRTEDEPAVEVAAHETMVLEGDGEAVRSGSGKARRTDQTGQRRGPRLQGAEHQRRLVENAHTTRVVHTLILASH